jgi:hypothetical protein
VVFFSLFSLFLLNYGYKNFSLCELSDIFILKIISKVGDFMYTERNAIEDLIRENRNHMKDLREQNMELMKRLRDLDERDMKTNSFDIYNELTDSLTEVVSKLSELIPHVPVQQLIEHIQQNVDTSIVEPAEKKPEPTPVQKAAQNQIIHMNPPKTISKERTASIIKSILEEAKGEVKTKQLEEEFYNRTGKKYANFNEQLKQSMKIYPSIEKAGHGRYKYVETVETQVEEQNEVMYS